MLATILFFSVSLYVFKTKVYPVVYVFVFLVTQGDSGSPLAYKNPDDANTFEVIGIQSIGNNCASGYPTIFTRVTSYLDWITSYMKNK